MYTTPVTEQDIIRQLSKIETTIHKQYGIPYSDPIIRKINQVRDGWLYHTTKEHVNQLHRIQRELHNDYDIDLDSNENGLITDLVELVKKFQP